MGKPRKKPPAEPIVMGDSAPETIPHTSEPVATEPKRPPGRPRAGTGPAIPSARNFFEKMADIKREDWGTRANLHLYRLEPYTDRLRSGTVVFIMKYAEPIDETRILMDHGSGRYRAMLTFRKPSTEKSDELDRHDFDLLNIKFPPKIPKGEWVDDPRNKKWEWARNFYENGDRPPVTPSQTDSVVETMRTLNEMRRDMREELTPPPAAAPPSVLDTIRAVKEILPQPAPATDNSVLNTVVTLMTKQIEASQEEVRELRKEMRERQNVTGGGFSVEKLVEGADKIMPLIERIWPAAKDAAEKVAGRAIRSNMNGWQEFLQPMMPEIIKMPVWGIIAQGMMMKGSQPQPAGMAQQMNPAQAALPPGQPQPATDPRSEMVQFLDELWKPMNNHLAMLRPPNNEDPNELGKEFAAWVYDGYSADTRYEPTLAAAKATGVPMIVGLYKGSPYWPIIAPIEVRFATFIEAMLKWEPPADEEEDDKIIDLTQPGAHA